MSIIDNLKEGLVYTVCGFVGEATKVTFERSGEIKRHGLEYDCMRIMTLGELIDRHRHTKADKKKGTIYQYEFWYDE